MKPFTTSVSVVVILVSLGMANVANADHPRRNFDYARVVDARPIYQTVTHRIPVKKCRVETVRVEHDDDSAKLVGGLIGAAIGHNLGHGKRHRGARTVAGAIIGASIADSATRDRDYTEYRDVKRCHTHYDKEHHRELVGYDVTYRYHGDIYHTRTDHHPGKRIRVRASLRRPY